MTDILLVSEAMRFPFKQQRWQMRFLKAKLYMIDWSKKKITNSVYTSEAFHIEEFSSLKKSYHYHGARGITSNEHHIFVAGQNVIHVYDHNLRLIKHIHNQLFNGLHEIVWHSGKLYVTCAVTDAILVIDEDGKILQNHFLGDNPFFTKHFGLLPRVIDNRMDYRITNKCKQLYHVNSVCVAGESIYAGFNYQGAFVRICPTEEVLIAGPELKMLHNSQFTPNGDYILINDTQHYSLQVFDRDCTKIREIDLRKLQLPIDFTKKEVFGDNHEIKAGWLRGLCFSSVWEDIVFVGLSPTCVAAINYMTGELVDYLKLRKNIWITIHGLHNLALGKN
jgi:hypothetical protein